MEAKNLKILAIDDNQDNLFTLQAVLGDLLPHATLLTALNGRRGLDLAAAQDPDVILLDIVMPGMDGFAVCRALKVDEPLRSIPVIFLTALKGDRQSRIAALEAGAEGFLAKPLDEIELVAQIRAMAKIKAANRHQRMEKEELVALVAERTRDLENELAERVQAEESLRESEERHRTILETALDGFWMTDAQGRLLQVNQAYSQMSGYSVQELLTMRISDLEALEADADVSARIQKIITQGSDRFETVHRRKDGSTFTTEVSTVFRPNEGGRFVAFLHDIPAEFFPLS